MFPAYINLAIHLLPAQATTLTHAAKSSSPPSLSIMFSRMIPLLPALLSSLLLWDLCSCSTIPARNNGQNPASQFPAAKAKRATYVGIEDTNYGVEIIFRF
jgi:hypothetical protein